MSPIYLEDEDDELPSEWEARHPVLSRVIGAALLGGLLLILVLLFALLQGDL